MPEEKLSNTLNPFESVGKENFKDMASNIQSLNEKMPFPSCYQEGGKGNDIMKEWMNRAARLRQEFQTLLKSKLH